MSENYGSTTYTPRRVLTPEEIQRQEMEAAIQRAMQMAEAERQRQLEILRRQHEEEIRRLEGVIQGLNSDHKASIKAHQKRLQELREQYDNKLNEAVKEAEIQRQKDRVRYQKELKDAIDGVNTSIDDLRNDTAQAIKIISSNIDQLQRETNQALAEQQAQINDIVAEVHQDKAKAAETKRSLIAAYQDVLEIVNAKNHRKYAPRQLDAIQARLRGIDALPDASACAILNTQFNNLLTLDANIEQARMEYEAKHLITLKAAEEVLTRMHENRNNISLTDGENNPLTDDKGNVAKLELDFWTEGEYGKLEKELEDIKRAVENGLNDPHYTTNDLDKALDRIAEINKRQLQLVIDSIERGNASQIRAEIADVILEHLEGQRFGVIERGYENDDARNAYIIKLEDGTSKIIIIINPESNSVNHVVIGTVETDLSEPELIQQGKDINEVLKDAGIETDGGICNSSNPTVQKALRDMYDIDIIKNGIPLERKRRANITK